MFFSKKSFARSDSLANSLLTMAEKVKNYRGDLLSPEEMSEFEAAIKNLDSAKTQDELSVAAEILEEKLSLYGGTFFPKKWLPEWVELIVVAAILAIGIRTFFVQPFKIPTNSMYPTYNGMTAKVYSESPSFFTQWAEKIFKSASFYEFTAPASGEVFVAFSRSARVGGNDIFKILVGERVLELELPRDFSMDSVLLERFFPKEFALKNLSLTERRSLVEHSAQIGNRRYFVRDNLNFIATGIHVERGESLLKFKIFGGDMVLVDRFSYHFTKPKVGDSFVFRTHKIAGLGYPELYYIKRIAGTPGDVLQWQGVHGEAGQWQGQLLRNGALIEGAEAFRLNNDHVFEQEYYGYLPNIGRGNYACPLERGVHVPANSYYALGDNSSNSLDSRGWGYVPADDVVGKALWVLYPFSKNWGLAK